MAQQTVSVRIRFFEYLFGNEEGFLCLATGSRGNVFKQRFFRWPNDSVGIEKFVNSMQANNNVWFCTSLLSRQERVKEACLPGSILWADLDHVDPSTLEPPPTCAVESSPGRFQAYWRLEQKVPADVQEDLNKRLAYSIGADKSGWDLTQLLRVPFTFNHKYAQPQKVQLISARETLAPLKIFESLADPLLEESTETPDVNNLPEPAQVMYAHRYKLAESHDFVALFTEVPHEDDDWSRRLWRLINICLEVGMTREETFSIAVNAGCNKYERDNRPIHYLWKEVVKAALQQSNITIITERETVTIKMPQLVDPDSVEEDSLVLDHKRWGKEATDAPMQYHELSCFIALSAVMSPGLVLKVNWGDVNTNLWGLILGKSTVTRKTTAMRMVMDILHEFDPDIVVGTDGSAEGILTGISARPQKVSIFYKDEVSGLFDSINKKDYYAQVMETFTQLYDGTSQKRVLRKAEFLVTDPYFIFFGGGVRNIVYSHVSEKYITSGFIPRFLVVCGESDMKKPTGPPTKTIEEHRQKVYNSLLELKEQYSLSSAIEVGGQFMVRPIRFHAKLDKKAWDHYNEIDDILDKAGENLPEPLQDFASPVFHRLSISLLKMAVLIAATRRSPNDKNYTLDVTKDDVHQAAWYIQRWGVHSVDLLDNAGKPEVEKQFDKIENFIKNHPGCTKSTVMNTFRLTARDSREVIDTLEERGIITITKRGRGSSLWPTIS